MNTASVVSSSSVPIGQPPPTSDSSDVSSGGVPISLPSPTATSISDTLPSIPAPSLTLSNTLSSVSGFVSPVKGITNTQPAAPFNSVLVSSDLSSPTFIASSVDATTSSSSALPAVATPSSCNPTIADGTFETYGPIVTSGAGESPDWSHENNFDDVSMTGTDDLWFANLLWEGGVAYSDNERYGYTALTGSPVATTYDIRYLHPVSLCAGTMYHVSGWLRNNRRASNWSEGCRATAFLDGQAIWSDRIAFYDWEYRYLDGTYSPAVDTTTAEFFLRVGCRDPQIDQDRRPRGVKFDSIAIVAESQYVAPPDIVIMRDQPGCLMFGNQFTDPSFEVGADADQPWTINNLNNVDDTLTGPVTDISRTGTTSYRFVFGPGGGSVGIYGPNMGPCAEREYFYGFWAKQAGNYACSVTLFWGNVSGNITRGPWTPVGDDWGNFGDVFRISPKGVLVRGGRPEFKVTCNAGGIENALWIDDVSMGQPDLYNS